MMRKGLWAVRALAVVALLGSVQSRPCAGATPASSSKIFINGVADTGQFLPDAAILARVADRSIRVYDFRDGYFSTPPQVRPAGDSLGRVEFLGSMIKKEVLGLAAAKANYQLRFEDRAEMRDFRNTLLGNMLYVRAVSDSLRLDDAQIRAVHRFYGYDLQLRLLLFSSREEAEAVRLQLLQGKLTWAAAAKRYAPKSATGPNGELGWTRFENLPPDIGLQIWPLKPGEFSPLITSGAGYHLVQVAARRPRVAPAYEGMKPILRSTLRQVQTQRYRSAIDAEAKQGLDFRHDSTNAQWASQHFSETMRMDNDGLASTLSLDSRVPEFSEADTGRVLVRSKVGQISLGQLLHSYSDMPPLMRPSLNTPEALLGYADALLLAPRLVEIAEQRGLDKDSVTVALLARKREQILVTRMVQDSVFSRVYVTKDERRGYYEQHKTQYVTFPSVQYAMIVRTTKSAADSVKRQLDSGVPVQQVLDADAARGEHRSGIQEVRSNEGDPQHKLLFEELRPGQSAVIGPDKVGAFAVFHLISFDSGRQLSYAEAEGFVDESLLNQKQEAVLEAFIARLAANVPVEKHPEWVMRIRLTDPTTEAL